MTLRDIAEEAGVSLMTVSNVVNGRHARVSSATIERIRRIVDRTGYVPNASARSLATRSSRVVGALVSAETDESLLVSAHTSAIIGALERLLRQQGYHLLLRGIADIDEVRDAAQAWNLDGVILIGLHDEDLVRLPDVGGLPVVAVDSYASDALTASVRLDDHAGGRLAAQHLLDQGHRAIVFAGPAFERRGVVSHRHDGFVQAHAQAGLSFSMDLVATAWTTYESGFALGRELPERFPTATAVFATADILAIGIMAGLTSRGLRVPHDLSVIGFDDIEVSAYVTPSLTTVAQDLTRKADEAARLLFAAMAGGGLNADQHVVLGVELVERDSVAPPNQLR